MNSGLEVCALRVCKTVKRPSEKILKVCVDLEVGEGVACIVRNVEVTGDFFAENPEGVNEVVEPLVGAEALGVDWIEFVRGLTEKSGIYGVGNASLKELAEGLSRAVQRACGGEARA